MSFLKTISLTCIYLYNIPTLAIYYLYTYNTYFSVVSQYYEAQVYDMFVIRGNTAIFKCSVPSFVSDYVNVDLWEATNGETYYTPNTDYGSYF